MGRPCVEVWHEDIELTLSKPMPLMPACSNVKNAFPGPAKLRTDAVCIYIYVTCIYIYTHMYIYIYMKQGEMDLQEGLQSLVADVGVDVLQLPGSGRKGLEARKEYYRGLYH